MKNFIFIVLALCSFSSKALNPGDIAFLAIQSDNPDAFAFVTLVNMPPNQKIIFTDRSWTGTALLSTEDTMAWTAPAGGLLAGTVIRIFIDTSGTNAVVLGGGTIVGKLNGISVLGDQIFALTGSIANPTFIAAIGNIPFITTGTATSNLSYLPATLTLGVNAFAFNPHKDNGYFTVISNTGTKAALQAALTDSTKFFMNDSTAGFIQNWPNWTFTISGNPPLPVVLPLYTISQVRTQNALGVADSINVKCKLRGVVTTVDFRGGAGYDFYIQDNNAGINVFKFADLGNNYQPIMGQEIEITGKIDQFNGLTEIVVDTITIITASKPLPSIPVVTAINEITESKLVKINNLYFVDKAAWPATGSNANMLAYNGVDTFLIRIDKDTNIPGMTVPPGYFSVQGASSQFDPTSPYLSDYQLFPRSMSDFTLVTQSTLQFDSVNITVLENIGTVNVRMGITSPSTIAGKAYITLSSTNGAVYGTHYTTTPAAVNGVLQINTAASATSVNFQVVVIDNTVSNPDRNVLFTLDSVSAGILKGAKGSLNFRIKDNDPNATSTLALSEVNVYPIPAQNTLTISGLSNTNASIKITDKLGRPVNCSFANNTIDISTLNQGIYFLEIKDKDARKVIRFVKE